MSPCFFKIIQYLDVITAVPRIIACVMIKVQKYNLVLVFLGLNITAKLRRCNRFARLRLNIFLTSSGRLRNAPGISSRGERLYAREDKSFSIAIASFFRTVLYGIKTSTNAKPKCLKAAKFAGLNLPHSEKKQQEQSACQYCRKDFR